MQCPRCGKAIPLGAAFCMFCGQALAARAPGPSPGYVSQTVSPGAPPGASAAFEAQSRKTRLAATVIGIVGFLAVLLLGLNSTGNLHLFGQGKASTNLERPAQAAPSALQKIASAGPVNLEQQATRVVMPENIKDWLEHLHQTELKRVNITNGQIAEGMVEKEGLGVNGGVDAVKDALNGIDDPNSQLHSPTDKLAQMIKAMHDQTADLQAFFDSYPAPDECRPIQAAYDQALSETAAEIGDISDHLAAGDINKLQSMQGVSVEGIDSSTAKADRLVGEICDKYSTKKWFSINKDIAPGGVFSIPGF